MLAGNQRLAVRVNQRLRVLEFVLYEYHRPKTVYEKPYAVPFEDLTNPVFDLGELLDFMKDCMPSGRSGWRSVAAGGSAMLNG